MNLEDYFVFLSDDDIRIAGTRVGIETVVDDYREGASPEEILIRYRTLTLEQIHATITYYLANREKVEAYVKRVRDYQEERWREQQENPSEFMIELRERLERERQRLIEAGKWPTS